MKTYIERAAVKDEILSWAVCINHPELLSKEDTMHCIDNMPAADVAPVRHGKWEPGNPICPVCGESKFKDLDADVWADWQPKFCPNCGARMGKEDEHEAG